MSKKIMISVKNLSKSFILPVEAENSLKSLFINPFNKRVYNKQTVLKNVSFDIYEGDFFGIVGRNGSGKSTLLKILAGIYGHSTGEVNINDKLTPFIELGVGFNPELTGRENVYLNGALLGFNRSEMSAMYDEIVHFAELEKFMDQKLKNYSSGMQVRLAFSIAIRAETPILLLDEVLAVGDEAFQRKCLDVFDEYKSSDKTVILVTHDMATVKKYCNRAMLLHDSKALIIGDPSIVAAEYTELNMDSIAKKMDEQNASTKQVDNQIELVLKNNKQKPSSQFYSGEELVVEVSWKKEQKANYVGVAISKKSGEYIFGTNTDNDKVKVNGQKITYKVKLDLEPGKYRIEASLSGKTPQDVLAYLSKGPEFMVKKLPEDEAGGLTRLEHSWKTTK